MGRPRQRLTDVLCAAAGYAILSAVAAGLVVVIVAQVVGVMAG